MRRIGLWMACGALALAFGCDGGGGGGADGGGITLPDSGPMVMMPDSGAMMPRPDSGPPPASCTTLGSFQMCANCFCMQNNEGCGAYLNALVTNIYCGPTCGGTCAAFCADPANVEPDAACNTCINGVGGMSTDAMGFQMDCGANMQCVGFAQLLQMCPST